MIKKCKSPGLCDLTISAAHITLKEDTNFLSRWYQEPNFIPIHFFSHFSSMYICCHKWPGNLNRLGCLEVYKGVRGLKMLEVREDLKDIIVSYSPYKITITPPVSGPVIHFKDSDSCKAVSFHLLMASPLQSIICENFDHHSLPYLV